MEICRSGILPSSFSQADISEESENDVPNENDDELQAMIKEGLKNGMFDPAEFLEVCKSGKLPPSFSQEDLSKERENNMPDENDDDPAEIIENTSDDDERANYSGGIVPIKWPAGISNFKEMLDTGIFRRGDSSAFYDDEDDDAASDGDTSQSSF